MSDSSDRLRDRACRALDDVALLRWRLGGLAVILIVVVVLYAITRSGSYVPSPEDVAALDAPAVPLTTTTTAPPDTVVDVAGAVHNPGLYTLAANARVADGVNAAGGMTPEADLDRINLAEKISDGQRIYVVRKGQSLPSASSATAGVGTNESGRASTVIDLNTTSVEDLDSLPGVGAATAQAILQHRQQNGPFRSVGDLADVKGIGPAKLAQLKDLVRV